jgi:intergrase/recombinase
MVEMGIALDVVGAVIGHAAGDKDTRILRRHYVHTDLLQRKTDALERWDHRLNSIVMGEQAAKVLPLPRRA